MTDPIQIGKPIKKKAGFTVIPRKKGLDNMDHYHCNSCDYGKEKPVEEFGAMHRHLKSKCEWIGTRDHPDRKVTLGQSYWRNSGE